MPGVTNGALARFAQTTKTSLDLPDDLSREDWQAIGVTLHDIRTGVEWWIGDWWRFGERAYGEAASQAAPTGYAVKTLQNAAWIATKVEPSRRREDLTIGHHGAVAGLDDPDEQDEWLDKAQANQWSVAETSARVRNAHRPVDEPSPVVKLLRRAAKEHQLEDGASGQSFTQLADEAWYWAEHGLAGS